MVVARNSATATKSVVAAESCTLTADTTPPIGKGEGFRPHQLLEAALASCTAITLRSVATERGIALDSADVRVDLDRSREGETIFRTRIDLKGALSPAERKLLLAAARRCPVRKTLSKRLSFADGES